MAYFTEEDGCSGPLRESDTGAWICPLELEGRAPDDCAECPLWEARGIQVADECDDYDDEPEQEE